MHIKWIKGLSKEEADTMRDLVSRNTILRRRLTEMLEEELASSENLRARLDDYDSPSWPYKQADTNGYQRAIKKVLELIG